MEKITKKDLPLALAFAFFAVAWTCLEFTLAALEKVSQ